MHPWLKRAQRFAVSGVLATALHVLVAVTIIRFVVPRPAFANGVAFVIATVFSYVVNTVWSFSSTFRRQNLLRFLTVSAIGCVSAMAISGLVDFYGMPYWIGIICVVAIVPPVTFLLHSYWTYG
jgi:putative flippase GtrA